VNVKSRLETRSHMLVECNMVYDFWVKAIGWWNLQSENSYTLHVLSLLYDHYRTEKKICLLYQVLYSIRQKLRVSEKA